MGVERTNSKKGFQMPIRLVNLGDIHFQSEHDWAVDKGRLLGRTIATSIEGIEQTVLVVNGDLTFSGTKEQFKVAAKFLDSVVGEFQSSCNCPCRVICTPGNHDCDFTSDQSARDELLKKLKASVPNPSIESVILQPLDNYLQFIESQSYENCIDRASPYRSQIVVSTSTQHLEISLLNSSWMSSKHDQTGSLLFPDEYLRPVDDGISRVVVLHHPPNWFRQPESMRDLIRWITKYGDLCFSGHEHCINTEVRLNTRLRGVMYFEGGVFQANPTDSSGQFQIVDIDTATGLLDESYYSWRKDHFARHTSSQGIRYAELTARASKTRLTESFIAEIEDPGIPGSPHNASFRLKDIFVFPDALEVDERESNQNHSSSRRKVLGRELVNYLSTKKKVLLIGPERCGKTALAKQLVSDLHSRGKMPVLFSGSTLAKLIRENKSAEKAIRNELRRQYADVSLEALSQNYRDDAIAIVDDTEDLYDHNLAPVDLANALAFYFPAQYLIASDEFAVLENQGELGRSVGLPAFFRLQLLDLGFEKINELSERWIRSAAIDRPTGVASMEVAKLITQVLATDFIPHHPWIVIVLLETSIRDDVQAMKNGSYGHLYHAILTAAMISERQSGLDLNGKFNYLSYLAYEMYTMERGSLTEEECREFHSN
jgi:GTPase SAR1 family protein